MGLLDGPIQDLDEIFYGTNNWNEKMTLADFWSAVGTVGIEYGISLSGVDVKYPIYFGRRDCSDSPLININDTIPKDFNLLYGSWQQIKEYFENELNFTAKDTITLMGAHTLVTTHSEYSGFEGKWTDDEYIFDNAYFDALLNQEWIQNIIEPTKESHWIRKQNGYNMLNSDIQIAYDIDSYFNGTIGEYQCIVNKATNTISNDETCPERTTTKSIIESYANDNQLFLDNFKKTWIRLVTMGYDDDALIVIDDSVTTETPDTTAADVAYRPGTLYNSMISIIIVFSTYNLLCHL